MAVANYRDLAAWQRAMDLAEQVYRITRTYPKEELYGLTNQLRRAAVSIPSDIAEGQGRGAGAEFAYHLRVANGSRREVETQLLLAQRLVYADAASVGPALSLSLELARIMAGLKRSITPS